MLDEHDIRLHIQDNLSGIARWDATLNGAWLLMKYDSKAEELHAQPQLSTLRLTGYLSVAVYDKQQNVSFFNHKI